MDGLREPKRFRADRLRLLAFDDSPFNRTVLTEILQGAGLRQARIARSPEELKDILVRTRHDAMLVPDMLGGENSVDFLRSLRHHIIPHIAQLPVILMSRAVTREHLLEARQAGVDEFLSKPISPAALEARLKSVCEAPRPFINCAAYVGPCRRRKLTLDYKGARRRLEDRAVFAGMVEEAVETAPVGRLAQLVDRLHISLEALEHDRERALVVLARVAASVAQEAEREGDRPLVRAAGALGRYIAGVGVSDRLDRAVIDTAVNAMTQLLLLSAAFAPARATVADALDLAVTKKLAV